MSESTVGSRSDAVRNRQVLIDAAAEAFVELGIEASTREVARRAGLGMGTLYRHFPTRADLVVAVYRHQVDACAAAGPALLAESAHPTDALHAWIDLFVDFLVTKHGLADVLQGDASEANALHRYFVDRLVPVCDELLHAASGAVGPRLPAYEVLRGVGNLCIGGEQSGYRPRELARALIDGVLASHPRAG